MLTKKRLLNAKSFHLGSEKRRRDCDSSTMSACSITRLSLFLSISRPGLSDELLASRLRLLPAVDDGGGDVPPAFAGVDVDDTRGEGALCSPCWRVMARTHTLEREIRVP